MQKIERKGKKNQKKYRRWLNACEGVEEYGKKKDFDLVIGASVRGLSNYILARLFPTSTMPE